MANQANDIPGQGSIVHQIEHVQFLGLLTNEVRNHEKYESLAIVQYLLE